MEHVFNVLGTMESCPTYFCLSPKLPPHGDAQSQTARRIGHEFPRQPQQCRIAGRDGQLAWFIRIEQSIECRRESYHGSTTDTSHRSAIGRNRELIPHAAARREGLMVWAAPFFSERHGASLGC